MLRFCIISLIVSAFFYIIIRRKKNAPIWFDLITAALAGIVCTAMAIVLFYVIFAGAFVAKER